MQRRAVMAGLAALPFARATAAALPTRSFRLGATRWPPDLSLRALGQVQNFLTRMADMSAPMILGGVPWDAAADDTPFSARLQGELAWQAPKGHRVLLSLGALDTMRRGLAPLYSMQDNQPLSDRWAGRPFDDPLVIRAYNAYCLRAAHQMRPDWLAIGVEVNLLLHFRPDLWPGYTRLHRAVYETVKAEFPDMGVLFTIAAQHFMGMADGADAAVQSREMAALMTHSDMAAFSIYPHLSPDVPDPIPPGFYDPLNAFAARVNRPAAISESGCSSAPVNLGWFTTLPGSPERQAQAFEALIAMADEGNHRFVINFASHDFTPLLAHVPQAMREFVGLWEHTGILDQTGADKAVTPHWRAALERPLI